MIEIYLQGFCVLLFRATIAADNEFGTDPARSQDVNQWNENPFHVNVPHKVKMMYQIFLVSILSGLYRC